MKNFSNLLIDKTYRILFISIIVIGGLAAIYALQSPFPVNNDAAYYLMGAEQISQGNGFYSYNIGFLSQYDLGNHSKLIPITGYTPLYSFLVGSFKFISGLSLTQSTSIINLILWILFLILWTNFYKKLFGKEKKHALFCSIFLIFSGGLWTYVSAAMSEIVFIVALGGLANSILYFAKSEKRKIQFLYLILIAISSTLLMFSRKAGLMMILSTLVWFAFFFLQKKEWKKFIFNSSIYSFIVACFYGIWWYRNYTLSSKAAIYSLGNDSKSIFNFDRIAEILNFFWVDALALPTSLESFGWFLTLLLFATILFLFSKYNTFKNNKFLKTENQWLLLSTIFYVGMIVFVGIFHHGFSRTGGFQRYFILTQLLIIPILVVLFSDFKSKVKEKKYFLIPQFFIGIILIISLLSNINRTRTYFSTLDKKQDNKEIYTELKNKISETDLVLTNHWQKLVVHTNIMSYSVFDSRHTKYFIEKRKGTFKNVQLILFKDIGKKYRKGFPLWTNFTNNLNCTKICENENIIWLKLAH